jgi:integrase
VLSAWRKKNPKAELVAPSLRQSKSGITKFLNWRTIQSAMKKALKKCGLKPITFYQAGRHTFASQWVLSGNSIYRLKEIMGHSSVQVTERYAHLTNQLTEAELARADVRLAS